ncbi:colicin immunity protein/pyocin immunity protein [Pseudomonas sp. SJZ080]|nr:colicin immunity protein/pyocin immunity protein [Pseudomonas sp. SJZ080]
MELKAALKDYTALEFQALVNRIWAVDLPKQAHDQLIDHFDRIVGHPQGADLLFYPTDKSNPNSPQAVVHHVRTWHHQQGMPAFKGEDIPVAKPAVAPLSPLARSLAEVEKISADVAVSGQVVEEAFNVFEQQISSLRSQQNTPADIPNQAAGIRTLEHAQHEALMAVRKYEFWKMRVAFVQSGAQRNLTYAQSGQAQWQSLVQQINAIHDRYLSRLASITQRHRTLHDEAEALLIVAHQQLIDSRSTTQTVHTISASLDSADKRPDLLLPGGSPVLLASQQADLLKAIRSAVAEFSWQNTSSEPDTENQRAAVLSFAFSSRADTQLFGVSVPLSELLPIEGQDWQHLAANQAEVDVPFRMSTAAVPANPGKCSRVCARSKRCRRFTSRLAAAVVRSLASGSEPRRRISIGTVSVLLLRVLLESLSTGPGQFPLEAIQWLHRSNSVVWDLFSPREHRSLRPMPGRRMTGLTTTS